MGSWIHAIGQQGGSGGFLTPILIFAFVIFLLFGLIFIGTFGRLYVLAYSAKCRIPVATFIGMWLRKVPPRVIVECLVMATKAGLQGLSTDKLEAHFLARGNVKRVVTALVAANKASIPMTFDQAAAIDLAGRDVLDAVHTSVLPKVIDCPNPASGRITVDAVCADGIQL